MTLDLGRSLDHRCHAEACPAAVPPSMPARPDADLRAAGMTGMFDTEGEPQ